MVPIASKGEWVCKDMDYWAMPILMDMFDIGTSRQVFLRLSGLIKISVLEFSSSSWAFFSRPPSLHRFLCLRLHQGMELLAVLQGLRVLEFENTRQSLTSVD